MNTSPSYSDISKLIDHSLLQPCLSEEELQQGIALARAFDVASVCILPYYLNRCAELLSGSTVAPSTTIGFPHGGHTTSIKVLEAERAVADGGLELDMVVNISQVLSERWRDVTADIQAVIEVAHAARRKVKVIFENAYLQEHHKIKLCEICSELQADWVKTSTGYAPSGATIADLQLMRKYSAPHVQVKAAGGVRDYAQILEVRALGVTRIGASRTKDMLSECRAQLGLEPLEIADISKSSY